MVVALGEIFSGVYAVSNLVFMFIRTLTEWRQQTSDELWDSLRVAGEIEHDRFWRMPLDDEYGPQIHSSNADLQNVQIRFCSSQHQLTLLSTRLEAKTLEVARLLCS